MIWARIDTAISAGDTGADIEADRAVDAGELLVGEAEPRPAAPALGMGAPVPSAPM